MSADTLLKSRSRVMLSMPRKKISRKKKMNTSDRWNLMERGCLIGADRVVWEVRRPSVGEFEVLIEQASSHYDIFSSLRGPKYPRVTTAGASAGYTAKTTPMPETRKKVL